MKKIYLIALPLAFVGLISAFFIWNLNYETRDTLIDSDIPDFKLNDLSNILKIYKKRKRNFGAL